MPGCAGDVTFILNFTLTAAEAECALLSLDIYAQDLLFTALCSLLTVHCSLLTLYCPLPYSLLTAHCSLCTAQHSLHTTQCSLLMLLDATCCMLHAA